MTTKKPMMTVEREDQRYVLQRPLGERVSALEVHQEATSAMLVDISAKMDDLLTLKNKGMGAIGFVSILFASFSGVAGVIAIIVGFFNGKH